jgi:hypothetical protein
LALDFLPQSITPAAWKICEALSFRREGGLIAIGGKHHQKPCSSLSDRQDISQLQSPEVNLI